MNKIKLFKYADKYIKCLNVFYNNYTNVIDEYSLNDEYDLMINILDDLMYYGRVSWFVIFENNKYKDDIIYQTDKECWKTLSDLYGKMWNIVFGF